MKYFFVFLFISFSSYAANPWTMMEVVRVTRERAPVIQARLSEAESLKAQSQQAGLLSNPSFLVQGGSIKSGSTSGSVMDLTLMQPLPFPGKRQALRDVQEASARVAKFEGQEEILALEHRAVLMAARLTVLHELARHTNERRERFDLIRKSLVSRPQVSPIQRVERSLIENQLRILERGIALMESERRSLTRELSLWLNTNEDVRLPLDWSPQGELESLGVWEERVRQQNFSLAGGLERKRQGEARLKSAELAAYPDFQVGVNYRQENLAPANHFYHAQVGITLPIFDRGQHLSESARAQVNVETARQTWREKLLMGQVAEAWETAQTQRKLLRTFNMNLITESERQFQAAESEFRKGRIDATTFLSTDAQIHESVDAAFQTTLDALAANNRLRELAGLSPES